jgi:uncharacterized membrane protein YhaH (DUF805 family)
MQPNRKIWFPAKKYGWGWGPPCCWQGWVVIISWFVILQFGAFTYFRPDRHMVGFYVFLAIMVALLMIVCAVKGEKPKWRWGNK